MKPKQGKREKIMTCTPNNLFTDIRGLGGLTIDGITGITDTVELLHRTIKKWLET